MFCETRAAAAFIRQAEGFELAPGETGAETETLRRFLQWMDPDFDYGDLPRADLVSDVTRWIQDWGEREAGRPSGDLAVGFPRSRS